MAIIKQDYGLLNGGGIAELLWTNSSPTTAFAAQTISVDLSSYDGVIIDAFWGDGDQPTVTNYHQYFYFPRERWTYNYNRIYAYTGYRDVLSITDSGVEFGTFSGGSSLNQRVVPIAIYGVNGFTIES